MTEHFKLNEDWEFIRLAAGPRMESWTKVDLPHSPFVADLDGREHWFGECAYRRTVHVPSPRPGFRYVLHVGAAMHSARVFVDEVCVGTHSGGYLPFEIDLTDTIRGGAPHVLRLILDNRDNADVPPGKPYADLDFCWYGGVYRDVELRVYPEVHVTDAVSADEIAGGGVFIRTLWVDEGRAELGVKVNIRNHAAATRACRVDVEVLFDETTAAMVTREAARIDGGQSVHVEMPLFIDRPQLWSIDSPALYEARIRVHSVEGGLLDERKVRFGIRTVSFSRSGGFQLNGRRLRLRGTNRHQEFPFVGYAGPRAAQYRDARRIKEAGFDYVRLSHYPQSPDFLDACDEIGIVVMNAIPGWQFMGGEKFREACYRNARDLIRRDRNHACVILWELSLNETAMDDEFMERLHAIGHEEFPGGQMFTCGWIDRYDVYLHSRQHGWIHRWSNADKALVIAEYGDWEFYAANEGFDQKTGAGVHDLWTNSRQFRSDGERGLRQQAWNHIIALNDTLSSPAALDGQWSMYDYARGYHPVRAACGVMDIFRLPKYSYYFYRSQRAVDDRGESWSGGPMVFIASNWTPASDLRVLVFSNCEEVELRLNGTPIGRSRPSRTWMTQHLPSPPFFFDLLAFVTGTLEATGVCSGMPPVTHTVSTPGLPADLTLTVDDLGVSANEDESDFLLAHARICDRRGTLCVEDGETVSFNVTGDAIFVGPSVVKAEAGIASVALRLRPGAVSFLLKAVRAGGGSISSACGWRDGKWQAVSPGAGELIVSG